MPGPKFISSAIHLSSADTKAIKDKFHITKANEDSGHMVSMFDTLSIDFEYNPLDTYSLKNAQALTNLIAVLSDPTSFFAQQPSVLNSFLKKNLNQDVYRFISQRPSGLFNRLLHPSKPCNPFVLVNSGWGNYTIVEQNWETIVADLAGIICYSLGCQGIQDVENTMIDSIKRSVRTAASHTSGSDGNDYTLFVKHISKEVPGGYPLFVIYQMGLNLGMAFGGAFPAAQMAYYYSIFNFIPENYEKLHPSGNAEKKSMQTVFNRLTSPMGPNSQSICL